MLLADRIVVMSGGRIVADETPGALIGGRRRRRGRGADGDAAAPGRRGSALLDAGGRVLPWMSGWPARSRCLPDYTAQHVLLSAVGARARRRVSLPLGVVAARRPRLRCGVLAVASLVQTIPGLALLALFYPLLLGALGADRPAVRLRRAGARVSALGAGADGLFDAADPAQRRHRHAGRRPAPTSRPPTASA